MKASPLGMMRLGTKGISMGVGLPWVSVRSPMTLWKYAVVRSPPFHQVEKGPPPRMVTPGFCSSTKRLCMARPTSSSSASTRGWML